MHRFLAFRQVLGVFALALAGSSHATLLNFDTWSQATRLSHGDRVSVFGPGYVDIGGATPNVVMDFVDMRPSAGTPSSSFHSLYASGYGNLQNALGHTSYDVPSQVRFTADPGWVVTLQSFNLGAWSTGAYPNSRVWVTNDTGQVLFDTGILSFSNNQTLFYQPMASSTGTLTLHINDLGDMGLDNVLFVQSPVPEPTSALLMAGGLLAVASLVKRRVGPR